MNRILLGLILSGTVFLSALRTKYPCRADGKNLLFLPARNSPQSPQTGHLAEGAPGQEQLATPAGLGAADGSPGLETQEPGARGAPEAAPAWPGSRHPRRPARPLRARPGSQSAPRSACREGLTPGGRQRRSTAEGGRGRAALYPGAQKGPRRPREPGGGKWKEKSQRGHDLETHRAPGLLPILAKLATRIHSAMMYGSRTWCHLKVTTWKPWLSSCALPGSSTPRTRGSAPSASSSASSTPQSEPRAPRPSISAAAQRPVRTLMACGCCCAGAVGRAGPSGLAPGGVEPGALRVRAAVLVPARPGGL